MRLSSLLLGTGVCLALTASSADAQARLSTELFIARNSALAPGSSLYGLGLTLGGGPIGLRASGAAAFRTRSNDDGESITIDAWTGEVDLILEPGLLGAVGADLPLSPYVFGGVGQVSTTDFDGFRQRWASLSYGGGLAVPLTRALGITGEARYRLPLSEALDETEGSFDSSFPRGWEYRFGLLISLGR